MSEELLAASKERIADLLEPIAGGVGEDISYDEQFEEIKNETEKLASLTGETCDWSSIGVTAEEILQEKSKDFRVACYLATCKAREGTLEGVLDGLMLMQEMAGKWWEEMYPPLRRIRARAGMVGWMSDQCGPEIMNIKLKASDGPMVEAIDELTTAVGTEFAEKFADHYPGMSGLRDGVRHLKRTCPKEAPKKVDAPPKPAPVQQDRAAPAAPAAPAGGGGPSPADITTAAEAERAVEPTGLLLVRIGGALRAEKPENELAYRFSRFGMWMAIDSAPPVQDGKCLVPPPPANIAEGFDSLAASQDWLALLNDAEQNAAEYILWLDPHRHACTAMSALGALFMKAKKELLMSVALFLKRLPTLPTIQFNDGTPLADGQTQMWIESEVMPVLGGEEGGGGGGGAPSVLDEPLKEARELAVKGELGKAIDIISDAAAGAPTPSERFQGKLAIAQLCLRAGQFSIARGQLEGLTERIDHHRLTTWDTELCAEVYGALYGAIKGANEAKASAGGPTGAPVLPGQSGDEAVSPEDVAAEVAAFERLCQLDPARALKLRGDKKKG